MKKATNTYKILGVDPGTNVLGYGLIEISGKTAGLLDLGTIKTNRKASHQEKLMHLYYGLCDLIQAHAPEVLAMEAPFFGKNIQSMLKLGRVQGIAIAAAASCQVDVFEYSPKKVKQSITGNGNAAKEQVAAMLRQIFRQPLEAANLDATDALAVALCHFYQSSSLGPGKKRYSSWDAFLKENPDKTQ